jgi:hypothetical protein
MSLLVLKAYLELIHFDICLARQDFAALHRQVHDYPIAGTEPSQNVVQKICGAMDVASIFYWKEVRCLQRTAATTCLLRQHGVPAYMVIGARLMPFKAHAWVEVRGQVVNDKPYIPSTYALVDRC